MLNEPPIQNDNRWTHCGRPALVAHRGYATRYPENTLESIRAAYDAGARFIEFDVQLSADRVPFLMHDEDLKRTTGESGSGLERTMSELRTMSAGEPDRFGARFDEIRIPTLCEAVALLKELSDCIAFVELKRESVAHLGVETVLAAALPELQPITERSVVVSFNAEVVENLRDHTDLKTAWVIAQWNDSAESMARRLRPDYLFCNYRKLPATNTPLWSGPWCWVLYEVRESATALRLKRMGADLIESMAVGELIGSPPFTPETPIAAP